ncbi:MAG: protein kinase [Planctomycetota bacterium]
MARVAVVEDNPHVRRFMETLLKLRGHEPVVFENGGLALEPLLGGGFDLVISDVQMPEKDGISLCKELRGRYSKSELPILLVSVLDAEEDILRALEAGANDYLVKPCSSALVSAKVAYHLRQSAPPTPTRPAPVKLNAFEVGRPVRFPCAFDKYVLEAHRGSGAYGVVYDAKRKADGYGLALKVLDRRVNADREMLARYFREVAALAAIENPHVVGFIDSGFCDGVYYLGMEMVPGETVWDQVYKGAGVYSVPEATRLAHEMLQALDAIHQRSLVHRDVKSANIIHTNDGRFVLIDFGLAKANDEQGLTNPDEFLGTAEFIAPEVITGDMQHIGSDIYALGVTVYEALTGKLPFSGPTAYEILRRIASLRPAAPVAMLRPEVPREVSDLVEWLMHPERDARPATPADALEEVQRLVESYPSTRATRRLPPPPPGKRPRS